MAYARQRAPGRLIVDNSACWGNFHMDTDIADWHTYWAIPERRAEFDRTVEGVCGTAGLAVQPPRGCNDPRR